MVVTKILTHFKLLTNERVSHELEKSVLKSLHKIKTRELFYMLHTFHKHQIGSEEYYAKLITILPMHIELMSLEQFTRMFEICIDKNLGIIILNKELTGCTTSSLLENLKNTPKK